MWEIFASQSSCKLGFFLPLISIDSSSSMFQKNPKVFELSLATFNYEHSHGLFNTKFSTGISSADLTE